MYARPNHTDRCVFMPIDVSVPMLIHFLVMPIYIFAIFLYILHFVHHATGGVY